jgi:hypothetical protein
MTYTVNRTNGLNPIVIADNTIDNSTSITLVGRNWSNYGSLLDRNFLQMLENFANTTPPANPIAGQLYYDTANRKLQIFDSVINNFKSVISVFASNEAPLTTPIEGDLWLDTLISANPVLKCYTNSQGWVVIGPPAGAAQLTSEILTDASANTIPVLSMFINNKRFAILAPNVNETWGNPFRPIEGSPIPKPIPGFHTVYPGFNINSQDDVSNNRFIGQSTDSAALDGLTPSQFMRTDVDTYTTGILTVINANGFVQGTSSNFHLHSDNNDTLFTSNINSARLRFQTTNSSGTTSDAMLINGNSSVYFNDDINVAGAMVVASQRTGGLIVSGTDASTDPTTGAAIIAGGVGIGGDLNVEGYVRAGNLLTLTDDTSTSATNVIESISATQTLQDLQYSANTHTFATDAGSALNIAANGAAMFTAADGVQNALIIRNSLGYGGYGASWQMYNTNGSNDNAKHFRLNDDGDLEIINSAYSGMIFSLSDGGNLSVGNNILTDINKLKITGGIPLQYVQTDGVGNLSWSTIDPSSFAVARWTHGRQITLFGDTTGNLSVPLDGSADVYLHTTTGNLHGITVNLTGDIFGNATFANGSNTGNNITINALMPNISPGGATVYYGTINVNSKGQVTGGNTTPPTNNSGVPGQIGVFAGSQILGGSTGLTYTSSILAVTGDVSATGDVIAFSGSDINLKTNIEPIADAVNKIKQISGVTYEWRPEFQDENHTGREAGVIAQEIEAVLPEAVKTREDGYLAVRYERLNALLIEAVKELTARIEKLEAERK